MDPTQLIPMPDTIPMPWPWFKALLIPCFTIHLLFMNALLGSAIIGCVHSLARKEPHRGIVYTVSQKLPFYMAFAINFGVAALLFMQVLYGHLFYTSSILMGLWWLSVLALVITAYGAAYWIDFRFDLLGAMRPVILAVVVICLLGVGLIFVHNLTLMMDPPSWRRYFAAPGGTLWHWEDPTLVPRYLHFVIASVAVGGLLQAVLHRNSDPRKVAISMQWFTAATAIQFVVGGWFFMALPQSIRLLLMGGNQWASAIFAIALLGVLSALYFGIKQNVWPAVWTTCFLVLAMVLVRDAVRTAYLAPYFSPGQLTVRYDPTPMVVFGLFVILGLGAAGYMLKLWKGASPR